MLDPLRVLVVDDSASNLAVMTQLVKSVGAEPVCHLEPHAALAQAEAVSLDLAVVDYTMPSMTGLELVAGLKERAFRDDEPIVMITARDERSIRHCALDAGVTDFIQRPIDALEVKARLRNLLRLSSIQKQLKNRAAHLAQEVARATKTIADREEELILRLSRAAEFRDNDTGTHLLRMAQYSKLIAEAMGMAADEARLIYLAAPLHDVGKIGVQDAILLKPGSLSPEQRRSIEEHALMGEAILAGSSSQLIELARQIAGAHHEKWDGTGYPRGLKGEDIPLAARIVAVADVFDALTSERPYKEAWTLSDARQFIAAGSGSHFDPRCVAAFNCAWQEICVAKSTNGDRWVGGQSSMIHPARGAP